MEYTFEIADYEFLDYSLDNSAYSTYGEPYDFSLGTLICKMCKTNCVSCVFSRDYYSIDIYRQRNRWPSKLSNYCCMLAIVKLFDLNSGDTQVFENEALLKRVSFIRGISVMLTAEQVMGKCFFCNHTICNFCPNCYISEYSSEIHPSSREIYSMTEQWPMNGYHYGKPTSLEKFLVMEAEKRADNWINISNKFLITRLETRFVTMNIIINLNIGEDSFNVTSVRDPRIYNLHWTLQSRAYVFCKYTIPELRSRQPVYITRALPQFYRCIEYVKTYIASVEKQTQARSTVPPLLQELVYQLILECYLKLQTKLLRNQFTAYLEKCLPSSMLDIVEDRVTFCCGNPELEKFVRNILLFNGDIVHNLVQRCFYNRFNTYKTNVVQ